MSKKATPQLYEPPQLTSTGTTAYRYLEQPLKLSTSSKGATLTGSRYVSTLTDEIWTQDTQSVLHYPATSTTKSILLVQDEEQTATLLQDYLQAIGYQVERINNGNDFWERMRSQQPNLILLDLELAGDVSGWDLLMKVRQQPGLHDLPIVAIASEKTKNSDRAFGAGANACFSKPIGIIQLESILMQYF
ncbi:response regulator [Fischerella sp. PCC 9605]|uniref:response regulator n=1 Tax=Fischerella sp. PCC 9605 TaxID=1173024 RepID=UPI0004B73ED4